jgi:hypothetical protein
MTTLRFRNFVLDGRKREQPNPMNGVNDVNMGRHRGHDFTHYSGPDHGLCQPDRRVHDVTVGDFMPCGIDVEHTRSWHIEDDRVQDIGSWKGLTECPVLTIPDAVPPPRMGLRRFQGGRLRNRDRRVRRRHAVAARGDHARVEVRNRG